ERANPEPCAPDACVSRTMSKARATRRDLSPRYPTAVDSTAEDSSYRAAIAGNAPVPPGHVASRRRTSIPTRRPSGAAQPGTDRGPGNARSDGAASERKRLIGEPDLRQLDVRSVLEGCRVGVEDGREDPMRGLRLLTQAR